MKHPARTLALGTLASFFVATVQAHPGHGGHELTWDLDHLAAHPGATVLCFSIIALGGWLLARMFAAGRRRRSGR